MNTDYINSNSHKILHFIIQ